MSNYSDAVSALSLISISISPNNLWFAQCVGFRAFASFSDRPIPQSLLYVLSASLSGWLSRGPEGVVDSAQI